MTFIAMNRFRIAKGREAEFEDIWANRESNLPGMPGFVSFKLLRGPSGDEHTLFASHVVWESRQHFEDWTRSEAFRKSHGGTARSAGLYLGPPQFEGFDVVLE
ncbi:antibiotic biosynthesis monooxygenase [Magnetospirillum sp. 64-120]|uniref:antibiotic biosynthesis monooxygenase family protein n=1 Tax=Magnetospirillum sp. 64-120 TaxID=1895778 RepID=UPI00092AC888|nr:antibiotic biosynthesis monooxygenase [Magnetospirillum sp. 64-120]OJX71351.1 MAG: antibiotic biosynthesis monooxygenase [Magnetospirillum sp. 64-120]